MVRYVMVSDREGLQHEGVVRPADGDKASSI